MRLSIEHRTEYRYDPPASRLHLRLKLFAVATAAQTIREWRVTVDGRPVEPLLATAYGEPEALVSLRRQTAQVEITASGVVETADTAGVLGRQRGVRPQVYLRDTPLTEPDAEIAALFAAASEAAGDQLGQMHALSALIGERMVYRAAATDHVTTAAEALALGAGVCQDFAHLFIAAARTGGIPARYVVGYFHDTEAPLAETHAWAEAHLDGLGWVGFDPVHALCPTEHYVRLCSGFDAHDAAPIRGTLAAGSEEELEVAVTTEEAQAQQQ